MRLFYRGLPCALLTASLVASGAAVEAQDNQRNQGQRNQNRQSQSQNQRDRWNSEQSSRRGTQSDRSRQSEQGSGQLRLDPRAWVTIGVDYDNDGRFDRFERIYVFDLERARSETARRQNQTARSDSDQRQMGERQMGERQMGQARTAPRDSGRQFPRTISAEGTVQRMTSVKMKGQDEKSRLALVETKDGRRLTACLGSESKFSELDLRQGDNIQLEGVKARLNGRTILMATKIRHQDQVVSVDLPKRTGLTQAKAEVVSLRKVRFKNYDQQFMVGEVKIEDGQSEGERKTLVNFGPANRLQELQLSEGDQVRILAREGSINGEQAMIAEEVRLDGDAVRLRRPQDRSEFQRSQQSGSQQSDQQRQQRQSQQDDRET